MRVCREPPGPKVYEEDANEGWVSGERRISKMDASSRSERSMVEGLMSEMLFRDIMRTPSYGIEIMSSKFERLMVGVESKMD